MAKKTLTLRIPSELKDFLAKISEKNDISLVEAGRELAREASSILNGKVKKRRIIREVRF
jgi:hypothetical protein